MRDKGNVCEPLSQFAISTVSMLLAIRTFTKVLVCASVAAARVGAAVIEFWF